MAALGKETFRRAILEYRNKHITAGIAPLMTLRTELIGNDEFANRQGVDEPTRTHFVNLLQNADRWRRRVTHNPDGKDLKALLADSKDTTKDLSIGTNPFGGDDIQNQSGGLGQFPWPLDGTHPDIPMLSDLNFANNAGLMLLGAVDAAVVLWTRLESRNRTRFITPEDSMRVYGAYQEMLGLVDSFMGDDNRVDVAQVLPSAEPLGASDSANRLGESANPQPGSSSP